MAKPSWVTTSPLNHTSSGGNEETTVQAVVSANGTQSNRSGTITVVGTVGSKTITRTISVSQSWGATIRLLYTTPPNQSAGIYVERSNVEDNTITPAPLSSAGELNVSYPFLGGSNICHYSCVKQNGVFAFELNKIHISAADHRGRTINADYWDIANSFFTAVTGETYFYTPVIKFTYNPSTDAISIVDTLDSLGGIPLTAQQEGGDLVDPVCPDEDKMYHTAEVGNEGNGYGSITVTYDDHTEGHNIHVQWPVFHWFPHIIKRTIGGESELEVLLEGKCTGSASDNPDLFVNSSQLMNTNWSNNLYIIDILLYDHVIDIDRVAVNVDMGTFYHPSMYEDLS